MNTTHFSMDKLITMKSLACISNEYCVKQPFPLEKKKDSRKMLAFPPVN